ENDLVSGLTREKEQVARWLEEVFQSALDVTRATSTNWPGFEQHTGSALRSFHEAVVRFERLLEKAGIGSTGSAPVIPPAPPTVAAAATAAAPAPANANANANADADADADADDEVAEARTSNELEQLVKSYAQEIEPRGADATSSAPQTEM